MLAIVPGGGRSVTSRSPFRVDPYETAVHRATFLQALAAGEANKELVMDRSRFALGCGKRLGRSHWVVGLIGALVLMPLSAGAGIVGVAGPAGADTATYSSAQVGT